MSAADWSAAALMSAVRQDRTEPNSVGCSGPDIVSAVAGRSVIGHRRASWLFPSYGGRRAAAVLAGRSALVRCVRRRRCLNLAVVLVPWKRLPTGPAPDPQRGHRGRSSQLTGRSTLIGDGVSYWRGLITR